MNLFAIAWKSVRQRGLASLLTAISVALGVTLMVIVIVIDGAIGSAFNQRTIAYDLIIGAKGSDLQLVMSSVYRIQPAIANLPLMYLKGTPAGRSHRTGNTAGVWRFHQRARWIVSNRWNYQRVLPERIHAGASLRSGKSARNTSAGGALRRCHRLTGCAQKQLESR